MLEKVALTTYGSNAGEIANGVSEGIFSIEFSNIFLWSRLVEVPCGSCGTTALYIALWRRFSTYGRIFFYFYKPKKRLTGLFCLFSCLPSITAML